LSNRTSARPQPHLGRRASGYGRVPVAGCFCSSPFATMGNRKCKRGRTGAYWLEDPVPLTEAEFGLASGLRWRTGWGASGCDSKSRGDSAAPHASSPLLLAASRLISVRCVCLTGGGGCRCPVGTASGRDPWSCVTLLFGGRGIRRVEGDRAQDVVGG
jgi:hypothetical protein